VLVKQNSWESLKRKLKQITKKTKPYGFEERLKKLVPKFRERGWVNNFCPRMVGAGFASISAKLKSLDEWLRNEERIHEHL